LNTPTLDGSPSRSGRDYQSVLACEGSLKAAETQPGLPLGGDGSVRVESHPQADTSYEQVRESKLARRTIFCWFCGKLHNIPRTESEIKQVSRERK